jgi:transcriptional antiterminator RfaH
LKQKENKNTAIVMNMNRFKQGEKIIIESGPFAGIEAVFKSYKGEERVIVLLNILSNISTLSLSSDMIEKVN